MRARCIAAAGDPEAAFAELERIGETAPASDLVEAERLHAAACVVLEAGDRELLEDAEAACRAARERVGDPEIGVTLGAVLIEQGRFREAEEILQPVFKATRRPWLEDRCLAYLALTARGLGRDEDAERFQRAFEERSQNRRLRRRLIQSETG
jgi:thioredoxin-like negative regulator of GroEL